MLRGFEFVPHPVFPLEERFTVLLNDAFACESSRCWIFPRSRPSSRA